MSDKEKKIPVPKEFTEGHLMTQPETLQRHPRERHLFIGIPKEITLQEHRIALVPSSVITLVAAGHRVVLEAGAGEKSRFSDHDYSEAGAEIVYSAEEVYKADIIVKVAPPTLDEIELMHPDQVLISPLQLPIISPEYIYRLKHKRVIALAMEYIKDDSGHFPIVRTMSEMAGISAILTAGELLSNASGGAGVWYSALTNISPGNGNVSDVVLYNTVIEDNCGGQALDYENGRHALIASGDSHGIYRVENLWILNCTFDNNSEDGIQLGQTSKRADQTLCRNIYIGGNTIINNFNTIGFSVPDNIRGINVFMDYIFFMN